MRKLHQKNTVRYYLVLLGLLLFLFFSGDFGLVDVQKTAIVMAVGVDREEDTFILTSQIAIPQPSKQGKSTETVQLVSRGATVAQAFDGINAKTGWYPKLVFCHLILLGEETANRNVFEALDFFLLDEYLSDHCLVATCNGLAADLLNVTALVDPSGSLAIQKVLSSHAERVGTVLPSDLREFSIGYFGENRSAFLPILKTQPQQENVGQTMPNSEENSSLSTSSKTQDKPVFSAGETALFTNGVRVGTFTKEETFAFNAVKNKLRLATFTVENDGGRYSLNIRHNRSKVKFSLKKDNRIRVDVRLVLTAGLLDCSMPLPLEESKDAGDLPNAVLEAAQNQLSRLIKSAFLKCQTANCDLFGVLPYLQRHEHKRFDVVKKDALTNAYLSVSVRFQGVR